MEYLIIGSVICAVIGAMIGGSKGIGGTGCILGLLFGPLGLLAAYFMQGDRRKCPFCAELIKNEAIVCPHCQRDVPKVTEAAIASPEPRRTSAPPVDLDHAIKVMREALEQSNQDKKK